MKLCWTTHPQMQRGPIICSSVLNGSPHLFMISRDPGKTKETDVQCKPGTVLGFTVTSLVIIGMPPTACYHSGFLFLIFSYIISWPQFPFPQLLPLLSPTCPFPQIHSSSFSFKKRALIWGFVPGFWWKTKGLHSCQSQALLINTAGYSESAHPNPTSSEFTLNLLW